MPETTRAADFDRTIELLQQDLASVDLALALHYMTQWENQLEGTEIFRDLMELKQSLLDGNLTELETLLHHLSEETIAMAHVAYEDGEAEIAAKIEQIGQLLSQASGHVR